MQKQINPDLFGIEITPPGVATSAHFLQDPTSSWEGLFHLEQKVAELRQAIQEMRDQVTGQKKEMQNQNQNIEKQINQILSSLKILEKNDQILAQQHQERNLAAAHKLQDLKNIELKVKEMIDQHHMVIRRYDVKIQQLQGIIEQKNQLLEKFQTSLIEARDEIARLKKA